MWSNYNEYKNRHKDIEEPDAPLVTSAGSYTTNNKEKCDEFAHYLHSVHSVLFLTNLLRKKLMKVS